MGTVKAKIHDMQPQQLREPQQLRDSLDLNQHLLQCVIRQLPVHPRQWSMLAATCSELRDAVDDECEAQRHDICSEYNEIDWTALCSVSGKLFREAASSGDATHVMRFIVARCPYYQDYWRELQRKRKRDSSEELADAEWSCIACTYLNPISATACELCATTRPE